MDLRDLIDPAELIDVVRRLQFPRFTLASYFPRSNVEAINYSFTRENVDALETASVRAWDAEASIGSRPGLARVMGELPPISQKIPLTEGDRLMLEELRRNSGENSRMVDGIFADAARMVRAVEARIELARGDALVDGIVTITENNLNFTIDYGVPGTHKVVAAATWANPATDILGHINSWVDVYVNTNGVAPARAIASRRVVGFMLQNDAIRALAGGIGVPAMLTLDQVNTIFTAMNLPVVEVYDVQVTPPNGVKQRVIPDDRFIMLPGEDDRIGATQYGTTVEALELANQGLLQQSDVPGVVAVTWKTEDPVHVWTKGAAIALPVIVNPDLLFTADVIP